MATPEVRRFAIDAVTALRIVRDDPEIGGRHPLVGPSVLRSHVLSMLHQETRDGAVDEAVARAQLETLAGLKIRLLGDRVSRATAFTIARRLDWPDTAPAEYLAVASRRPMFWSPVTTTSRRARRASCRSPTTTSSTRTEPPARLERARFERRYPLRRIGCDVGVLASAGLLPG